MAKREDLQVVRSYKIRGAYNMIQSRQRLKPNMEWFVRVLGIMHKGLPLPVVRRASKEPYLCPLPRQSKR